jgi:hypothetical protein
MLDRGREQRDLHGTSSRIGITADRRQSCRCGSELETAAAASSICSVVVVITALSQCRVALSSTVQARDAADPVRGG